MDAHRENVVHKNKKQRQHGFDLEFKLLQNIITSHLQVDHLSEMRCFVAGNGV